MGDLTTLQADEGDADEGVALISAYVPRSLRLRLKVEAARRDTTTSALVTAALEIALVDAEP